MNNKSITPKRAIVKYKYIIIILILFFSTKGISVSSYAQPPRRFSAEEIKSDLDYLRDALEASHYNLYAYTPKETFDNLYKKIELSLNEPLTSLQVYRLFQPYVALSKMGHCQMDYPFNEYFGNYINQGGTVFPLNLYFSQGHVFIKSNFSGDSQIAIGDELISLNEKPIKEVMGDIYNFISGESEYHKNSVIEDITFPRIYWFIYDKCDVFNLEIRKKDGREIKLQVHAISGNEFEGRIAQHNPLRNTNREFKFIKDVAYLYPGAFMNPSNDYFSGNTFDTKSFLHFLDSCFTEIHGRDSKFLIIDLRNNLGGMSSFSMSLITYFATKPFGPDLKVTYKTSQATKDGLKNINDSLLSPGDLKLKNDLLSHDNGSIFEEITNDQYFPQNDSLRFKGKVYILVNRFTYSEAIETSALIQDYKFGTIIGEMTPNAATMYASIQQFKLPNTQLSIQYPRAFLERKNKEASLVGVIPDFQIEDNPLTDEDEILDYTIELIHIPNQL
jgi:C-terminal processing protease CtpA/Prc